MGQKIKKFDFVLHLHSNFDAAGSNCSSENAMRISAVSPEHSLPAYVTDTIQACACSWVNSGPVHFFGLVHCGYPDMHGIALHFYFLSLYDNMVQFKCHIPSHRSEIENSKIIDVNYR